MKSSFIFSLLILSIFIANGQTQVNNFKELMEALNTGNQVKAVFHYAKCQLISDNEIQDKIPDAIGGMTLEVYEYFAKGAVYNQEAFLVSSTSKLIKTQLVKVMYTTMPK